MRQLRIKRTGALTVLAVLLLAASAYAAVIALPSFLATEPPFEPGGAARNGEGIATLMT